jgi:predicted amidohydrolase YtcJ
MQALFPGRDHGCHTRATSGSGRHPGGRTMNRPALFLGTLVATLLLPACGERGSDVATSAAGANAPVAVADAIYTNARVYTVDASNSWAEAIAVRGDAFMAVGSKADIEALAGPATVRVDLGGRMVMPGIHDMHAHLPQAGTKALFECGFPFSLGIPEIIEKVKGCAAGASQDKWIRGGQWALEALDAPNPPHRKLLDAVAPDVPVFLMDSTVHAGWVNSKALEVLGITRDTPNPTGGVIVRDANGDATGILLDYAVYSVVQKIGHWSQQQMEEALTWSISQLNAEGVTAIKEAMANGPALDGYAALQKAGKLNAHLGVHLIWRSPEGGTQEDMERTLARRAAAAGTDLHTDFVKIMLDGIPPSQTAALLEPYVLDAKHAEPHRGYLTIEPPQLTEDVVKMDAQGLTVKIHATGDRSVRVALDAIEAARKANPSAQLRHEISHAEMISPEDMPRFKALNVTAEMSPILWYPSPLHAAMETVLGKERAGRFWPVKSFVDSGALVIYGSDWPSVVPSPSPWPGIEAMVTRLDPYGVNAGNLNPAEAVDLATALRIFTRNGAEALYTQDSTGSIEVGKSADFIVLDHNLFEIAPEQIGDTKVLRTVFRGRTVHEAK